MERSHKKITLAIFLFSILFLLLGCAALADTQPHPSFSWLTIFSASGRSQVNLREQLLPKSRLSALQNKAPPVFSRGCFFPV